VPSTRPIHRQAFACAIACTLVALVALVAPAANAQDLRSPDARDAALAQEYYGSYGSPSQDLRSPDARDAGRVVEPTPPADTAEPVGRDGIAPLPFGVALFGALIAGIGLATALHALQGRRRAARAA
jgi:hypothetical protein